MLYSHPEMGHAPDDMSYQDSKFIERVLRALSDANWQGTKNDLLNALGRADGPLALGIARHAEQCLKGAGYQVNGLTKMLKPEG